ncbi:MAG TPA: hypothetical protein VFJ04_05490 [Rhodanobacteraceae bacterium]|jgi:hypothetical protein|nr:hypothetical protein [Rhodanobacteraceae bacterium]
MSNFKQVLGALSRDMLFLHGYIVSVRNLDGAAQGSPHPVQGKNASAPHRTNDRKASPAGKPCAC